MSKRVEDVAHQMGKKLCVFLVQKSNLFVDFGMLITEVF